MAPDERLRDPAGPVRGRDPRERPQTARREASENPWGWAARVGADEGQVSLIRMLLVLAIVGFAVFETGAVFVNRYQVSDIASQAAAEANITYFGSRSEGAAENRAEEFVEQNDATFVDLAVDQGAQTMSVTAEKSAKTLVIHRIDRLKRYVTARSTQSVPLRR